LLKLVLIIANHVSAISRMTFELRPLLLRNVGKQIICDIFMMSTKDHSPGFTTI